MKIVLVYYLYMKRYPFSEILQWIFNQETQNLDLSLVEERSQELKYLASEYQVINFYFISVEEIQAVLVALLSISVNLGLKFLLILKVYLKLSERI